MTDLPDPPLYECEHCGEWFTDEYRHGRKPYYCEPCSRLESLWPEDYGALTAEDDS